MPWDRTHGIRPGAFMIAGAHQLYVRAGGSRHLIPGTWYWYVDGILMGTGDTETVAKAAGEAAVRAMSRTHTARMAAVAREPGCTA